MSKKLYMMATSPDWGSEFDGRIIFESDENEVLEKAYGAFIALDRHDYLFDVEIMGDDLDISSLRPPDVFEVQLVEQNERLLLAACEKEIARQKEAHREKIEKRHQAVTSGLAKLTHEERVALGIRIKP